MSNPTHRTIATLIPNGLVLLRDLTFQYLVGKLSDDERRLYQNWPTQ